MTNKDKQIAQFIDAINKNAIKECKRIEKATKKLYTGEAEKLEKSAKAQVKDRISYAKTEIETEFNKSVASSYSNCRAEISKRRTELTDEVFEKAEAGLIEFTKKDEYIDFLSRSLKSIYNYVGGTLKVFVKPDDHQKALTASDKVGIPCEVNDDPTIFLGGIRVECDEMKKIFDDTLDSRLEDQKEWFLSNSNFKIND